MNVAVINIRDIFKNLVLIIIGVSILIGTIVLIKSLNISLEFFKKTSYLKCMDIILPNLKEKNYIKSIEISLAKTILDLELGIKNNLIEDLNINEEELTIEDIQEIIETATTEVIEDKNIKPSYTNSVSSVNIKNQSDYEITEEMLNSNIEIDRNKNIILFHTHTCESYTTSEQYNYEMTGNYRTTDLNYNVARLGSELKNKLESKGLNIIHNSTYHDYPAYSGSYSRSEETVKNILSNSNSEIVIDIHRDAVGDGSSYGPTVKINDEIAAQLMFVIGTDGGGLEHPNWRGNLKFAIKVQEKANELYPGLFRPIILTNSRYNQQLAKYACIIEVGATGNTLDQALVSMKYLGNVISEILK